MAEQTDDITIIKKRPGQDEQKDLNVRLKEEKLRDLARDTRALFNAMQDELDNRSDDLKDGLSFLDLKNDTLLSYMIDVCNIVLRKVRGETIEGHPSVERCVEYRVILEKLKGIDQKLAYQLNKLITMPEDAEQEDHRVDINNLDIDIDNLESDNEDKVSGKDDGGSDEEDDEDDDDEDSEVGSDNASNQGEGSANDDDDDSATDDEPRAKSSKQKSKLARPEKPGIYKPPKLRSVAYDQGGRRKNYDDFYKDDENGEYVEETRATVDEDRVRYEEDHYTRLPDENPKKTKRKLKTKEYRKKGKNKFKKRR